jgi:hypothetical protein
MILKYLMAFRVFWIHITSYEVKGNDILLINETPYHGYALGSGGVDRGERSASRLVAVSCSIGDRVGHRVGLDAVKKSLPLPETEPQLFYLHSIT